MKTNKFPNSAPSESLAAGSQKNYNKELTTGYMKKSDLKTASNLASNDDDYSHLSECSQSARINATDRSHVDKGVPSDDEAMSMQHINTLTTTCNINIPERIFMNGLIKHTAIALAIIIPLAAFSAYAAPAPAVLPNATSTAKNLIVKPDTILYNTASVPTTVDSVDLNKYVGTWYEIGRLPMYFQRNCAQDVKATYTNKPDSSGISVLNQCLDKAGKTITAEGLAKVADESGSRLKVTFLPSWIRWLPVGRADYWVLARDPEYKTALVGTPDKEYLWILARSPNISQETYAKYRQIAQQQGYDLREFKLTPHKQQTVKLMP